MALKNLKTWASGVAESVDGLVLAQDIILGYRD